MIIFFTCLLLVDLFPTDLVFQNKTKTPQTTFRVNMKILLLQ